MAAGGNGASKRKEPTIVFSESSPGLLPSRAFFRSVPRSRAVWYRVVMFFASALAMTASKSGEILVLSLDGITGSSWRIFFAIVQVLVPVNGFSPVRNW